ncbi:hypothetical protein KI387_028999 [Taxus chinensis]|uniref:SKP1-like protein n=1 Tax=Taxus chinensis TaxID=29808 RepID=A0AA38CBH1_TAXCH|nr:hypothetical protein KI387_028999 [Taxus chinensis]
MAELRKVTLKSSDNELFEVEESVAMESLAIKSLMEDITSDAPIPVSNVRSQILAKVLEYCKYHLDSKKEREENMEKWDRDFVEVDQETLFDLILAANYLNIQNLLDLTCKTVADMIKGKTPEQIRQKFNITNDFTPEEEAQVRNENAWAFE